MSVAISVYRACVGGYVGGGHVHPALLDAAREGLAEAKDSGLVADGFIARCGDDIDLVVMNGSGGADGASIAREVFGKAASAGARLRQHGCNGGVELDGAELMLRPRSSEPVLCFFSNKASPAAWDLFAFRLFADPFVSAGLVTDSALRHGFAFETRTPNGIEERFDLPAQQYELLAALRAGARIRRVRSRGSDEIAAVVSGADDPMIVLRCESPFPGVEDALDAFAAQSTAGPVGGSLLVPVSANGDSTARSMPRAMGLGFQVTPDRLVGPRDLLGDGAFDDLRREAVAAARRARSGWAIRAPDEVPASI